jgi:hypothetical protein
MHNSNYSNKIEIGTQALVSLKKYMSSGRGGGIYF